MSRPANQRPRYPNKFLVIGVAGVVVGGVLLLLNLGYLPQPGRLWPIPVLVVGLFFLYMAWPRKHSDTWIIPGMVLTLGGLVFLLSNTVLEGENLQRIWPLFMLVTGVSLVPYALRKKASARAAIIVPAVFISFLALFFLVFSLHREEGGGLAAFVRQWWPMILVVLGIALIISFFSTRRPSSKV
ncbi:MAG: LiaI-LiaF-like domain-containing protein [Spirochaetia bacterium]